MGESWKVWTKLSIWERRSVKGWTLRLKSIDASRAQCRYWKDLTCSGNKRGCQPNGKFKHLTQFCVSKLLYSLEALQPTEAAASKLDTFQLKGLRKILKMSTTYIDRANTNHEVYRRANLEIGLGRGKHPSIKWCSTGKAKKSTVAYNQKTKRSPTTSSHFRYKKSFATTSWKQKGGSP